LDDCYGTELPIYLKANAFFQTQLSIPLGKVPLKLIYTRFEVFKAEKIQVEVFWVVTPCRIAAGYQRFRCPCCIQLHPELKVDVN
jgi:hypothetical protein